MDRNLFLALTLTATFQCFAQTPEPFEVRRAEAVFEELPELKASEILKPEFLKGPHFVVRDPVPTGAGMNQFTISLPPQKARSTRPKTLRGIQPRRFPTCRKES
jgi:hypothetical protein